MAEAAATGLEQLPAHQRLAGRTEAAVLALASPVAAMLVVMIACILLAGVIARYIFGQPLNWADELASVLFLWLVMFGSVIALGRNEHMRLMLVLGMVGGGTRALLEAFSTLVITLLLCLLIAPAFEYAIGEWIITTPALEMPDGLRVLGIGVGLAFMLALCGARLLRVATLGQLAGAAGVLAVLVAALVLGKPLIIAMGKYNLLLFFVVLVAGGVLLGVPIGFAFGAATVAYITMATRVPLEVVVGRDR
ncbi:TRAP transporter small permease [Dankookia sp. P2]|uniref:TRAP transporter small permease n=1 Tax=Dankookia sp. P2 TaxID=3423955 RepID=UPI003D669735